MQLLDMGPEFQRSIRKLRDFAATPSNWYYPFKSPVPGDNPAFVVKSGTLCIVFTWTVDPELGVVRHLSISTMSGRTPNLVVVATVATKLGFTGAAMRGDIPTGMGPDWMLHARPDDPTPNLMVIQAIPRQELPPGATSATGRPSSAP